MSEIVLETCDRHRTGQQFAQWVRGDLRDGWVLYAMLAAVLVYTVSLSIIIDVSFVDHVGIYIVRALRGLTVVGCALVVVLLVRALLVSNGASPLALVRRELPRALHRQAALRMLYAGGLLTLFMAAFLFNKQMIPKLVPYSWDPTFAEWDRMLAGGRHAWEVIHPLLGYQIVTILVDYLYSAWVSLMFIFWMVPAASTRVSPQLRRRYWLATLISWVAIGLLAATMLSSAGPVYFAHMPGGTDSYYGELNAYLEQVHQAFPLGSSVLKVYLWDVYSGTFDEPGGISAMPSMHNAQAVLFAALGFAIDRRLGWAMTVYAIVIFLGSIHLAWHYAVDGLIGGGGALLVWWLAGPLARIRPLP